MPPDAMAAGILGFRLVTQDLARLVGFYRNTLGFAPAGATADIGRDELLLLGVPGAGRRQALRLGWQTVAIEQFDTAGRPYPTDADAASLSFQHLALVVPDMAAAYARVCAAVAISVDGPQQLPPASGGVRAFKFRDPDGHPLELLQFPAHACPAAWRDRSPEPGQIGLGIDHSAISVASIADAVAFFASLGLTKGARTLNRGLEQERLDGLRDVEVSVVPMWPHPAATPHVELLCYHRPGGRAGVTLQANDVAATRIVWRGTRPALLRGPDGHLQQIDAGASA